MSCITEETNGKKCQQEPKAMSPVIPQPTFPSY